MTARLLEPPTDLWLPDRELVKADCSIPLGIMASGVTVSLGPFLPNATISDTGGFTATSTSVSVPTGTSDGDLLIMIGKYVSGAAPSSGVSGVWTQILAPDGNGNFWYKKTWHTGDPTSYTIGKAGANGGRLIIVRFSGATNHDPLSLSQNGDVSVNASGTTVTYCSSGVTTTQPNTVAMFWCTGPGTARTFPTTCPSTATMLLVDNAIATAGLRCVLGYQLGPTAAGAFSSKSGSPASGSSAWVTNTVFIY